MIKSFEKNSKTKNKNEHKKNLNKKELEALEALKKRDDIIITSADADKGGALVIKDVETYMNEANRQLSNTSRPSDPVDFKIFTGEQF